MNDGKPPVTAIGLNSLEAMVAGLKSLGHTTVTMKIEGLESLIASARRQLELEPTETDSTCPLCAARRMVFGWGKP